MKKKFKIKKYRIFILFLLFSSINTVLAQEYTDQELQFDRAVFRAELLSSGTVSPATIETRIDEIRANLVLKKKLGFDAWLESKRPESLLESNTKTTAKGASNLRTATVNFYDTVCPEFTFNDPISPLHGWNLFAGIGFSVDSIFISVDTSVDSFNYLPDYTNGFPRFSVLSGTARPTRGNYDKWSINVPETYPQISDTGNVLKIGNRLVSQRKEMISRTFELNDDNDFLVYNYAIILEDPGHTGEPFYSIDMYINGVKDSCATVRYVAKQSNLTSIQSGFIRSTQNTNVYIRPWSSNIIKPSSFGAKKGDAITIELNVSDCDANGHFGYGYFDVECKTQDELIQTNTTSFFKDEKVTFSTPLDQQIALSWVIKKGGNNIKTFDNTYRTFDYTFLEYGIYTIELTTEYFTTTVKTPNCNTRSVFTKVIEVKPPPCQDCSSFDLIKNEKYLVSAWVKEEAPEQPQEQYIKFDKGHISISFTDIGGTEIVRSTKNFKATGDIIDGWQRIVGEFTVPDTVDDMKLELVNGDDTNTITTYFDDIRILPTKASMKSFVYDQTTQRLMAELDENNFATFYEYDLEGGLVRVKKETEKGVFTIQETRSGNPKKE